MDLSMYLPTGELQMEFEEFRKLQSEEERQIFKQERLKRFETKTGDEKKAYIENSQKGLNNAMKESESLIERVNLGEVANTVLF